jgi:glycosyltransferase involved in cell wall biosynthesis
MDPAIDFILPVHNEGGSIGATLQELYDVVHGRDGLSMRIVVAEDGSRDNTVEVVRQAAEKLPILLLTENARKGYSKAVIDGIAASTAPLVSFLDSDGQCDPRDFLSVYEHLQKTGCDLVVGYRNPRRDHWIRLLMSACFGLVYKFYFRVKLRDLSSPYLLIRREALERIRRGNLGILKQGFWWEFYARAAAARLRIEEVPVNHRARVSGETRVYRASAVPGIAVKHLRGLAELHAELKHDRA